MTKRGGSAAHLRKSIVFVCVVFFFLTTIEKTEAQFCAQSACTFDGVDPPSGSCSCDFSCGGLGFLPCCCDYGAVCQGVSCGNSCGSSACCVLQCPADISVFTEPTRCDAFAMFSVTFQTCIPSQTAGLPSGQRFPIGVTTNTFANAVDSCSFKVTVVDNEKPIAVCKSRNTVSIEIQPNTVEPGVAPLPPLAVDDGSSDNCLSETGVTRSVDRPSFNCQDVSVVPYDIVFTIEDSAGNSDSCSTNVFVTDPNKYCYAYVSQGNQQITIDEGSIVPSATFGTYVITGPFGPFDVDANFTRVAEYTTIATNVVSTFTVPDSPIYPDNGVNRVFFAVTNTIPLQDLLSSFVVTVTVNNVAPIWDTVFQDITINEGDVITRDSGVGDIKFQDPGLDFDEPYALSADWLNNGSFLVTQDSYWEYNTANPFPVSVPYPDGPSVYNPILRMTDNDAGFSDKSFKVTVLNVAPVFRTYPINIFIGFGERLKGEDVFGGLVFFDPAQSLDEPYTVSVDLGSGFFDVPGTYHSDEVFFLDFDQPFSGASSFSLKVQDSDGDSSTISIPVTVVPVITVTLEFPSNLQVDEGTSIPVGTIPVTIRTSSAINFQVGFYIQWFDGSIVLLSTSVADGSIVSLPASPVFPDGPVLTTSHFLLVDQSAVTKNRFNIINGALDIFVKNVAPVITNSPSSVISVPSGLKVSGLQITFTDVPVDVPFVVQMNFNNDPNGYFIPLFTSLSASGPSNTLTIPDFFLPTSLTDPASFNQNAPTRLRVVDKDNGVSATVQIIFKVTPPILAVAYAPTRIDVIEGSFIDAGTTIRWTDTNPQINSEVFIDWKGDGNFNKAFKVDQTSRTATLGPSPVFPDGPASFNALLIVRNTYNAEVSTTIEIRVINDVPRLLVVPFVYIDEGSAVEDLTIGVSDSGVNDGVVVSIDWMASGSFQEVLRDQRLSTVSSPKYPAGPAAIKVPIKVEDSDGASSQTELVVYVNDVNPVFLIPPGSVATVKSANYTTGPLSFTDAFQASGYVSTIDWGDGSPIQIGSISLSTGPDGKVRGTVTFPQHNYCSFGSNAVTITLSERDLPSVGSEYQVIVSGDCSMGRCCPQPPICSKVQCGEVCQFVPISGPSCDDGDQCTVDDKCSAGVCRGTVEAGLACDDNNLCSLEDHCTSAGVCVGTARDCDDDETCTIDSCSPLTGQCEYLPDLVECPSLLPGTFVVTPRPLPPQPVVIKVTPSPKVSRTPQPQRNNASSSSVPSFVLVLLSLALVSLLF